MMKFKPRCSLADFFKDSRGHFDVFSVVNLFAGLGIVFCLITQGYRGHQVQVELIYSLLFIYLTSNLNEKALAAVIERGIWKAGTVPPEMQITADVKTDSVNVGASEMDKIATDSETKPVPDFLGKNK